MLYEVITVIVGLLNVARMVAAAPDDPLQWGAKLFLVPFFCVHYGMFTAVHGAFVFGLFECAPEFLRLHIAKVWKTQFPLLVIPNGAHESVCDTRNNFV